MATSNKPRGAVLLDKSQGSTVISKTANPKRADVNQAQGPRTGNSGTPSKQKGFIAEKSRTGSYRSQLADMVSSAFGKRGEGMKPNRPASADPQALKSISPVTNTKRGPTRG